MFYEVKANLTTDQLRTLRDAGVVAIQPGVESLSTHVLELMKKGSSRLINIRLLKWAQFYGVRAYWNLIYGFPGETDADYESQIDIIPALHHLRPPIGVGRIWLERFSPYFYDESFPVHDVTPTAAYRYIYPSVIDTEKIAYYFDYRADGVASDEVLGRFSGAVDEWQRLWTAGQRPTLQYERGPGWIRIGDSRRGRFREATLDGWRSTLYQLCDDRPRSETALHRQLERLLGEAAPARSRVTGFLDQCVSEGFIAADRGHYLSLALPVGRPN